MTMASLAARQTLRRSLPRCPAPRLASGASAPRLYSSSEQPDAHDLFEEGMLTLQAAHKDANIEKGPDQELVQKAMALLKAATEADANFGPAQAQYGLSLLTTSPIDDLERYKEAAGHLERGLQTMDKEDKAVRVVKMGFGDALFSVGKVEEALAQYRSCLADDLDSVTSQRLYIRLFFAYLALCKPAEAREAFGELPPQLLVLEHGLHQLEKVVEEGMLDTPVELPGAEGSSTSTTSLRQHMFDSNVQGWRMNFRRF